VSADPSMRQGGSSPRDSYLRPRAGRFLILCGVIGLITGLVPLGISVLRLLGVTFGLGREDWAAHGVEAMGLDVPWATLSSADGTFLGALLLAAGIGWLRGRSWAPLVTLIYGLHGALITGLDLLIFASAARAGAMRAWMLVLDGIACALAVGVLAALGLWWWGRR